MRKDPKITARDHFKGKKFVCAPTIGIDMFQTIADDFMKRILGLDPGEYLITDESSISDFIDFTEARLNRKILKAYDLDVSEIKDGNLLEIFRRIHARDMH